MRFGDLFESVEDDGLAHEIISSHFPIVERRSWFHTYRANKHEDDHGLHDDLLKNGWKREPSSHVPDPHGSEDTYVRTHVHGGPSSTDPYITIRRSYSHPGLPPNHHDVSVNHRLSGELRDLIKRRGD